jgi:hypothetical protein
MDWDDLTDTQKNSLVKQMMVGTKKSAENFNRAKMALASNPFLVEKYLKELESDKGFEKYKEDEEQEQETYEDDSGFDLGVEKENEAEV